MRKNVTGNIHRIGMELNRIYNEDCFLTMHGLEDVDVILTSPPYNTSRKSGKLDDNSIRYEEFDDSRSDEEYIDWTCKLFVGFDDVLKKNGCVLYNLSYSSENVALMWKTVNAVMERTPFTIADSIVWKKPSAIPNNRSANKLTRICEFIFVFCRKTEIDTFCCYKEIESRCPTGQPNYKNYFNFVEAPNNDENCPIHKATYSSLLCRKLLLLYSKEGDLVYDPFMGTGTTAIACIKEKRKYVGSELSKRYCAWAEKRIKNETSQLSLW